MLSWLRSRSHDRRTALKLYGAIVTAARAEPLFRDGGVADSVEGRAEMLMAHVFAAAERLNAEGEASRRLTRYLIEAFITDVDDNLREMGVGDLTVPRKVKRTAAGFYERARAYTAALDSSDEGRLARELVSFVPGLSGNDASCNWLAAYMRRMRAHLSALPAQDIAQGRITFPELVSGGAAGEVAGGAA